ncbi:maleylpyruvate isomerase N-terminal domain-containing protein [Kitasatospora sp. NPDC088391]|uniref:maleylpyruvate isomerase N-terminal domain-containing protein n=1 Tax=Kitasatospora sp. NPDC088391 TaxID=3364074 RepID=UPI00382F9346
MPERPAPATGPVADPADAHRRTRLALADAVDRVVQLLSSAADLRQRSALPAWTAGEVATHLSAVFLAYCSTVPGQDEMAAVDWPAVLPGPAEEAPGAGGAVAVTSELRPTEVGFGVWMAEVNARAMTLVGEQVDGRPGAFLTEHGARFLRTTAALDPDTAFPTPWYGPEPRLTVAAATGLLLSECLLHGLDIARAVGLPWPIDPDHARLVLGQAMPTMMPRALDRDLARGVEIAYDLAVRGGPRLQLLISEQKLTVTTGAPPRTPDCRISADPVAFLLVAFHRDPQWKAILRGRLRAGGRRPWLATRLTRLVPAP